MKTVRISLNSIDKVKSFVNDLAKFDVDFDLVSGRYVIDAKSIMGIFSLDLSKPIDLNIHAENDVDSILLHFLHTSSTELMLKLEGSRGNAALFFYTSLPAYRGRGLLARNNVAGAAFNKAIVRIPSAAVRP